MRDDECRSSHSLTRTNSQAQRRSSGQPPTWARDAAEWDDGMGFCHDGEFHMSHMRQRKTLPAHCPRQGPKRHHLFMPTLIRMRFALGVLVVFSDSRDIRRIYELLSCLGPLTRTWLRRVSLLYYQESTIVLMQVAVSMTFCMSNSQITIRRYSKYSYTISEHLPISSSLQSHIEAISFWL